MIQIQELTKLCVSGTVKKGGKMYHSKKKKKRKRKKEKRSSMLGVAYMNKLGESEGN